jgi:hypothetical protein
MKREPSIHITESYLIEILNGIDYGLYSAEYIAKEVTKRAKNKSLNHRSVSVTNDKMDKKIKNLVKSSESDTSMLSNLIYHYRRRKSKLYTKNKIEPGNKEYNALKELTSICLDFCNTFNLTKREGFLEYIDICIPKISSTLNLIQKMINMAEKVYQVYEAKLIIMNDENAEETKLAHDTYVNIISERTSLINDYSKDPTIYIKFIELRKMTDELNVPIDIFIKAQFHGLVWTGTFPEPNQLLSDKSKDRLNKYLFENKIKLQNDNGRENKFKALLEKIKNNDTNRD